MKKTIIGPIKFLILSLKSKILHFFEWVDKLYFKEKIKAPLDFFYDNRLFL